MVLSEDASSNIEIVSAISIIDANEGVREADTEYLVDGYITIVPLDGDNTARSSHRRRVKRRIGKLNSLLNGEYGLGFRMHDAGLGIRYWDFKFDISVGAATLRQNIV